MNAHAKVLMLLITKRLSITTERCNLIPREQAGFRPLRETLDNIIILKEILHRRINTTQPTTVAFIDIKKAYDSVSHPLLFHKLSNPPISLSGRIFETLKAMYGHIRCALKTPYGSSLPFPYTCGLRQGCPLSPLLFNLFLSDLSPLLQDHSLMTSIPFT